MDADHSHPDDNGAEEARLNKITEQIIGCEYTVHNKLGCGFNEKVYENALAHELLKTGGQVEQQLGLQVWYDEIIVGVYLADLWVVESVPVELKVAKAIDDSHVAQALNQFKASRKKVGLVLNFGTPKLGIRRVVNNF